MNLSSKNFWRQGGSQFNTALSMKVNKAIQLRLVNQKLAGPQFDSCIDVVSHFGAMQSQDYAMAKWAVGLRTRRASDPDIEMRVNSGEIIRTHVLRPTWHFVSSKDIRWMMQLSAPYVKKATQYVDKQVGLNDTIFKKAWKVIAVELEREDNLSKEDLMDRLARKKIIVNSLMATQILIRAELEMRLCNGVKKEKKNTYSLFDRRVPAAGKISKKESIVRLASVYFNSRGPATVKDFMWWSGLSMADAKFGVSALGANFNQTSIDGLNYLYPQAIDYPKKKISALLPAYDEYMVGYSEGRNMAFPSEVDKGFLGNGIFKPIVLSDNTIVGTWRKISKAPFIEVQFINENKKYNTMTSKVDAVRSFFMETGK